MNYLLIAILLLSCSPLLNAQSEPEPQAAEKVTLDSSIIMDYYKAILAQKGKQYRYEAATLALQKYESRKEEYCSRLYNLLAEEATLHTEYEQAVMYYQKTIETEFVADKQSEGLLAEQEKIKAYLGLRQVSFVQQQYTAALEYHESYLAMVNDGWEYIRLQNEQRDALFLAECYQAMGESEQAITTLSPYAFGSSQARSEIYKPAIDHLVQLLQSKYPKRVYKKMQPQLNRQIYMEEREGKLYFYIQILQNRVYFPDDGAGYTVRVAQNPQLQGQAVAHYQRKFQSSYFYQKLMNWQ